MAMYVFQPYPAWLTGPNGERVVVANAEAEAEQKSLWATDTVANTKRFTAAIKAQFEADTPALPQLDHDGDGKPGGSLKPEGDDMPTLRAAYKEKFGKKPFAGWDADTLKAKMESAE